MPKTLKAASLADVPPGGSKLVTLEGIDVALFNVGGKVCAVDNACPHRGGPLSDGPLQGQTAVCPWHAWEFDVTTGACLNNPAVRIRTFPVEVQGADIHVTV